MKELDDRAVITWSLTEPFGGVQDMSWRPTVNRFQAVLHQNGTIEMSYDEVAAKDAIVGIYPMVTGGIEKQIGQIPGSAVTYPLRTAFGKTLQSNSGQFNVVLRPFRIFPGARSAARP